MRFLFFLALTLPKSLPPRLRPDTFAVMPIAFGHIVRHHEYRSIDKATEVRQRMPQRRDNFGPTTNARDYMILAVIVRRDCFRTKRRDSVVAHSDHQTRGDIYR